MDIVKKLTNEFSRQDFTNSREDLDAGGVPFDCPHRSINA